MRGGLLRVLSKTRKLGVFLLPGLMLANIIALTLIWAPVSIWWRIVKMTFNRKKFQIGDLVCGAWLETDLHIENFVDGMVVKIEKMNREVYRYRVRDVNGYESWQSPYDLLLKASADGK